MKAAIIAVGDELVLGQTVDTNSAWLSARLVAVGIMPTYHLTVADDLDAIAGAIVAASAKAGLVVVTGGLGPTKDDLTRDAIAKALDTGMELHVPSLERIEAFFRRVGRPMSDSNRLQAMCPVGAKMLDNDCGTAPGIEARFEPARVFALPGVPVEMESMFERHILPSLSGRPGRVIRTGVLRTFGAGESTIGQMLGDLMKRDRNPVVGTTVSGGVVGVRIRSDFPSADLADAAMAETEALVRESLGDFVYGRGEETLQDAVAGLLKRVGRKVVTAESCTGGLLSKFLTDVPGASEFFSGGWVCYSNRLKVEQLGVRGESLAEHGAVSEAVALEMAAGAIERSGADYALALTGIAGPGGGTPQKPVGTVWIALACAAGAGGGGMPRAKAALFMFPWTRELVRDRAAKTALNILRLELLRSAAG